MSGTRQDLAADLRRRVNLADARLGACVVEVSDQWFGAAERMLQAAEPVFEAGKYDANGKWMDGWETRRRRGPGHDLALIRLGLPGRLLGIEIDTRHFTGNYPPAAGIEGCWSPDADPGPECRWFEVLPTTTLQGDSRMILPPSSAGPVTHLRLHIYPDGGIARLRAYGEVQRDWAECGDATLDLLALANGGRALACNDEHYGSIANLLRPGRGVDMGDGWETRRRREPGHDWALLALGHRGRIAAIEVDTAHFKGNYPDRCSIQAADARDLPEAALVAQSQFWPLLLEEQALTMDAVHRFADQLHDLGPLTHLRLNIIPDGGVSRLRAFGRIVAEPGRSS